MNDVRAILRQKRKDQMLTNSYSGKYKSGTGPPAQSPGKTRILVHCWLGCWILSLFPVENKFRTKMVMTIRSVDQPARTCVRS